MPLRTHYVVLGVPENADSRTIRHAFRSLARRYHPDVGSGSSAAKFHEVAEAYDILGDVGRRRQYDIDLARLRRGTEVVAEPLIPISRPFRAAEPVAWEFDRPLVDWLDFFRIHFC